MKVKDYLKILKGRETHDFMGISPVDTLGVRGECLIACFTPKLFDGDIDKFTKRIGNMASPITKSLLGNILNGDYKKNVLDVANKYIENIKEEDMVNGAFYMADGKLFALDITLPYSGDTVRFTPITENKLKDKPINTRYNAIKACITAFKGDELTEEGVENILNNMQYLDFEFIYLIYEKLNKRLAEIDWSKVIKK